MLDYQILTDFSVQLVGTRMGTLPHKDRKVNEYCGISDSIFIRRQVIVICTSIFLGPKQKYRALLPGSKAARPWDAADDGGF